MKKPKKKRNVAISTQIPTQSYLSFYANETIAECAKEFGQVRSFDRHTDRWSLEVDERYDFDDVVAWLESFN